MEKYLFPFLTSFLLTVLFSGVFIFLAKKFLFKLEKRKGDRHIHKRRVSRLGGAAMVISFLLAVFFNPNLFITPEIYGLLGGSFFILIFGLWDDFRELFWKGQLFFQVSLAVMVFISGVRIYYVTNPITGGVLDLNGGLGLIFSVLAFILWVVILINSMNWLDGVDGLSSGVSFLSATVIFLLSLKAEVNQPPIAILSAILAGSFLGLLIFNFHPAKIMAGTSGSVFMGFSLAILAVIAGTKIATALLVLAIPLIDFFWVIFERFKNGRSIFQADKNHLHHKLLGIGWSEKKISLYYYLTTFLIGILALSTRATGKSLVLILVFFIMSGVYLSISEKISKKNNA